MEKKRLRRKCSDCEQIFYVRRAGDPYQDHYSMKKVHNFVCWTFNPFQAEVYDDHTLMWLCDNCVYESSMDI